MPIGNGGIIGPANVPTLLSAKGVWSLREAQLAQRQGIWPLGVIPDPYFEYTTLLLPGNGTNGAQNNTFLDASTNNFTITRNGNTTQGTFSPFSQTGWGNYFDGSSSLTPSSGAFLNLGTNPYTIEFFVYLTANSAANHLVAANDTNGLVIIVGNTKTSLNKFGVGDVVATGSGLSTNTWHHVAVVRAGTGSNQTSIYINGSQAVTGTDSNNWTVTTNPRVAGNTAGQRISGYISNLRVVTSALYSGSTINVPTAPFSSSQSGTTFLTCQSNRFLDNGTTGATFTVTGSPSVQAFSPFNPLLPWTAANNGGSGYFDGNGDYLNTTSSASLGVSNGNFTLEFWVYQPGTRISLYPIIFASSTSFIANNWSVQIDRTDSAGKVTFFAYNVNTLSAVLTSNATLAQNSFYHIAFVRNGATLSLYINGTLDNTANVSTTALDSGTTAYYIGSQNAVNTYFYGYISGLRLLVGSASAPSSIPTSPPTAITNTQLLLNFTNAGITDATAKNDLETVGNAQISTTQSKWGGGSMYFDGTGDYLQAPISPNNDVANGNFTIEAWIYPTSTTGGSEKTIVSTYTNGYIFYIRNSDGRLQFDKYGVGTIITGSTAITANVWTYVAVTRSGNTWYIFINGTQDATATSSTTFSNTSTLRVADSGSGTQTFYGYIDDLRITKGLARYTANFTLPTAAFPTL